MLHPKPISHESIPRALSKAERYRLLNEPFQAESICRDVLAVDPANQEAIICLILAMTDTFQGGGNAASTVDDVKPLLPKLTGEYERLYYEGVVHERWGRARLLAGYPVPWVNEVLRNAMRCFEGAEAIAPDANDDAVLRWNACLRIMERSAGDSGGSADSRDHDSLDDDVPMR